MRRPVRILLAAVVVAAPLTVITPLVASVAPAGAASAKSQCNVAALQKTTSPVQLTFWESMPEQNGVELTDLTNAFNASQSHVHVTLVNEDSYQETWTKVQSALTTGDLPDVTQLEDYNQQGAIDSKAFMPVQTCIDATNYSTSDFLPRILDYWKVKGVEVGMPFNVSAPLVFYNKNSFTKAGLNPDDPPTTMAQYLSDAAALKKVGLGTGFMVDPSLVEYWLATEGQLFVNNSNGRSARATKAVFDTPAGQKLFSTLSDLVRKEGAVTNSYVGPDEFDNLLGIGSGKYGMTIDYSSALGTIETLLHNYPNVSLGVGPFPLVTGTSKGGVPAGGAALYITAKDSPVKKAAAWEYIEYLDSTSSQATWAAGTGYIPIRKSAAATSTVQSFWAATPGYKIAYDQLTTGTNNAASAGPVIGAFSTVQQDLVDVLDTMFQDGTSPAKATANAESQVTQAMQSYNSRL